MYKFHDSKNKQDKQITETPMATVINGFFMAGR
jgi:hypothetical protein